MTESIGSWLLSPKPLTDEDCRVSHRGTYSEMVDFARDILKKNKNLQYVTIYKYEGDITGCD